MAGTLLQRPLQDSTPTQDWDPLGLSWYECWGLLAVHPSPSIPLRQSLCPWSFSLLRELHPRLDSHEGTKPKAIVSRGTTPKDDLSSWAPDGTHGGLSCVNTLQLRSPCCLSLFIRCLAASSVQVSISEPVFWGPDPRQLVPGVVYRRSPSNGNSDLDHPPVSFTLSNIQLQLHPLERLVSAGNRGWD
jgi:hypothetical protein